MKKWKRKFLAFYYFFDFLVYTGHAELRQGEAKGALGPGGLHMGQHVVKPCVLFNTAVRLSQSLRWTRDGQQLGPEAGGGAPLIWVLNDTWAQ